MHPALHPRLVDTLGLTAEGAAYLRPKPDGKGWWRADAPWSSSRVSLVEVPSSSWYPSEEWSRNASILAGHLAPPDPRWRAVVPAYDRADEVAGASLEEEYSAALETSGAAIDLVMARAHLLDRWDLLEHWYPEVWGLYGQVRDSAGGLVWGRAFDALEAPAGGPSTDELDAAQRSLNSSTLTAYVPSAPLWKLAGRAQPAQFFPTYGIDTEAKWLAHGHKFDNLVVGPPIDRLLELAAQARALRDSPWWINQAKEWWIRYAEWCGPSGFAQSSGVPPPLYLRPHVAYRPHWWILDRDDLLAMVEKFGPHPLPVPQDAPDPTSVQSKLNEFAAAGWFADSTYPGDMLAGAKWAMSLDWAQRDGFLPIADRYADALFGGAWIVNPLAGWGHQPCKNALETDWKDVAGLVMAATIASFLAPAVVGVAFGAIAPATATAGVLEAAVASGVQAGLSAEAAGLDFSSGFLATLADPADLVANLIGAGITDLEALQGELVSSILNGAADYLTTGELDMLAAALTTGIFGAAGAGETLTDTAGTIAGAAADGDLDFEDLMSFQDLLSGLQSGLDTANDLAQTGAELWNTGQQFFDSGSSSPGATLPSTPPAPTATAGDGSFWGNAGEYVADAIYGPIEASKTPPWVMPALAIAALIVLSKK